MNIVSWASFGVDCMLLMLSVILGSLIGYEREVHGKTAGLRTHALVSFGAAILTIISIKGMGPWEGIRDPGRIVGQMVAGIGFLGAGTIMRDGLSIKGLTTAASLWSTCFIGIAVGLGMLQYAAVGTLLVVLILAQLSKVERIIGTRASSLLRVSATDRPGLLGDIAAIFGRNSISINRSEITTDVETGLVLIELQLNRVSKGKRIADICSEIKSVPGVRNFELHE